MDDTAGRPATPRNPAAWVAVAWGVLFAVPSFVWATGHTAGATSTVSPELVAKARDGVTWFLVVLWLSRFLKLFASAVGLALARPRGTRLGRFAAFCGSGAAVLLAGHGLLFVVGGVAFGMATLRYLRQAADRARFAGQIQIVRYAQVGAAGGALVVLLSTLSGLG